MIMTINRFGSFTVRWLFGLHLMALLNAGCHEGEPFGSSSYAENSPDRSKDLSGFGLGGLTGADAVDDDPTTGSRGSGGQGSGGRAGGGRDAPSGGAHVQGEEGSDVGGATGEGSDYFSGGSIGHSSGGTAGGDGDVPSGGATELGGVSDLPVSPTYQWPPPQLLTKGRLSATPSACWVGLGEDLDDPLWQAARERFQAVIDRWTLSAQLDINWSESCSFPNEHGIYSEDIRILLDTRVVSTEDEKIDGCDQRDMGRTWASSPDQKSSYDACRWNMSIAMDIKRQSSVLHAAGHALGLVHDHFGWSDQCPELTPAAFSWSPYLEEMDANSVMFFGMDEYERRAAPTSRCDQPESWLDFDLSPKDQLQIEMLYPSSDEHNLMQRGGSTGLTFNGHWVIPKNKAILLAPDWRMRGASSAWFMDSQWYATNTASGLTIISDGIEAGYSSPDEGWWTVDCYFSDPFMTEHVARADVEVSSLKHTAVIAALF